jgi:hypothetical protein
MFIYLCMYTTYMNNVLHGSSCIKQAYTLTRVAAGEDPVWQPELVFGTEMSHTLFVFSQEDVSCSSQATLCNILIYLCQSN